MAEAVSSEPVKHFFLGTFSPESEKPPSVFNINRLKGVKSLDDYKQTSEPNGLTIKILAQNAEKSVLGRLRMTTSQDIQLVLSELPKNKNGEKCYKVIIYPSLTSMSSKLNAPIPVSFTASTPITSESMKSTLELTNLQETK